MGLPELCVSGCVVCRSRGMGEYPDKAAFMPRSMIFEAVKKMRGFVVFRVDFPHKMIHLNSSLIYDSF